MRRIGSIALAALLIAAMGTSATAAQKTFKAASGTPTIDGKMDDAYKAAEAIAINVHTSGAKTTEGTAYCLWDANNIYVLFDITDPAISTKPGTSYMYNSDSVEFFMDLTGTTNADITKVNAAQYTAPGPVAGQDMTVWGGRGGHWDKNKANAKYSSAKTDKGYIVEMQIPWGADYTPKANAEILTVFHINSDENADATRDGEVFANEGQTKAWSESLAYDKLVLTDAVYKAPVKDTAPATADAGIIAAIAALASSGAAALSLKKRK